MKGLIVAVFLLFVGCGRLGEIHHEGEIKVTIDASALQGLFRQACTSQLGPGISPEQIEACTEYFTAQFLAAFAGSIPTSAPINQ